jgi:hypothetical protein
MQPICRHEGVLEIRYKRLREYHTAAVNPAPAGPRPALSELAPADCRAFGNCPQYIQPRQWHSEPTQAEPVARRYRSLPQQAAHWITEADTFLIATVHRARGDEAFYGMDASHRGGEPGFVTVADARTLSFPDYAGNNHFNTIGNLQLDPRVGLLFIDFQHGHLLQLTGTATIDWNSPAVTVISGARRLVNVTVEEVVEVRHALPLTWGATGTAGAPAATA